MALTTLAPLLVAGGLAGCSSGQHARHETGAVVEQPVRLDAAQVRISPASAQTRAVSPQSRVRVTAAHGSRLTDVTVTDDTGQRVGGRLSGDDASWTSAGQLAAGRSYTVTVAARTADGHAGTRTDTFRTTKPDKLLTATFTPGGGSTVGAGEPIVAKLNVPVKSAAARAVVQRGLKVTSSPAVTGSWYWVDSETLHYRPKTYWPAHSTVTVASDLAGTRVQGQVYGGKNHRQTFRVGDVVIAAVNAGTDEMKVTRNGKLLRTIPVSAGKPGFSTRNGIKVVLEKDPVVRMTSESIGIPAGSPQSYDLMVYWADRVTDSGEFLHAAPWSAGAQGVANTSHGCVGMSVANAKWFFNLSKPGDIVTVKNSKGSMMPAFGNGFGDWNLSWAKWQQGSALHGSAASGTTTGGGSTATQASTEQVAGGLRPLA